MGTLAYFLVWAALFFVMMRFGCGAHVMGHGHHHRHDRDRAVASPPATAVDPVCGMTVDTRNAKSSAYKGQVYFFCSAVHRDDFEANPERYATQAPSAQPKQMEHVHE